jgi:hypothetical protein
MSHATLYHITEKKEWEKAQQVGHYTADSLQEVRGILCCILRPIIFLLWRQFTLYPVVSHWYQFTIFIHAFENSKLHILR